MLVEQNEWCGNCDWEDILKIDTDKAEVQYGTDENGEQTLVVLEYEWTCPQCEYAHVSSNDEEVGANMASAWVQEGYTGGYSPEQLAETIKYGQKNG